MNFEKVERQQFDFLLLIFNLFVLIIVVEKATANIPWRHKAQIFNI